MHTTLPLEPAASSPLNRLSRVAGWAAYASGVIGAVSVLFFALFMGAYVFTAYLGQASGRLSGGVLWSWLAVPYFGYPLWAFWVGRRLLAAGGDTGLKT